MKRSAIFLTVLMFCAMTLLLANWSSAEAGGGNCQGKLVGKSYDCNTKYSGVSPTSDCFEFETGGFSKNFDVIIDGLVDYGCSCDTTGSFNSPSFDGSSSSFDCLSTSSGFLLNGKVKGKKLSGQGTSESGDSAIFTCVERSSACP